MCSSISTTFDTPLRLGGPASVVWCWYVFPPTERTVLDTSMKDSWDYDVSVASHSHCGDFEFEHLLFNRQASLWAAVLRRFALPCQRLAASTSPAASLVRPT